MRKIRKVAQIAVSIELLRLAVIAVGTRIVQTKSPLEDGQVRLARYTKFDEKEYLPIEPFATTPLSFPLGLIEIGAEAIHVPFHTTWAHEEVSNEQKSDAYKTVSNITDILKFL